MSIEPTVDLAPKRATESQPGSPFFYLCQPLAQRAALLLHLLATSRQPIFVVAERGMGKTSLLEHLLAVAPEYWAVSHVDGEKLSGRQITAKRVLEGFGLKPGMRSISDGPTLTKMILAACGTNRIPVLLIDDAHKLPSESLSLLMDSAPWDRRAGGLHMALFCTPLIDGALNAPELRARLRQFAHRIELSPFTEQQTREYLVQRSAAAGREGPLPLSAAQVRTIFNRSLGVPRRINEFAREALAEEDTQGLDLEEDPGAQPTHPSHGFSRAAAAVIVVLAILGLWVVRQPAKDSRELVLVPPITEPDVAEAAPKPPSGQKDAAQATTEAVPRAPAQEQPQPANKADVSHHPARAEGGGAKEIASGLRGPDWLRAQKADHYVVQLFASHDRKAVFRFLDNHKNRLQLAWFSTVHRSRRWYTVVEGLYPDSDSARAAVAKSQSMGGVSKPWPRPIASIKEELKKTP